MEHEADHPNKPRLILAGLVAAALLAAGCGSGSASGSRASSEAANTGSQALDYARCMRSHGVPNFPDPGSAGASNTFLGIALPASINPQSPAFQSANNTCKKVLSAGGVAKPPITAQQKQALLANAECVRKHGVPNFPDPTFPPGGGISQNGIDPQSPAFQEAERACPR